MNYADISLFKGITLEEIFDSQEINEIYNELFKKKESSRYMRHNQEFDRRYLILKLLSLGIDSLKTSNKTVSKGLQWVQSEIQYKIYSNEATTPLDLENLDFKFMNDPDYKNIIGWIDEPEVPTKEFEFKTSKRSVLNYNFKKKKNETNIIEKNIEKKVKRHSVKLKSINEIDINSDLKNFIDGHDLDAKKNMYTIDSFTEKISDLKTQTKEINQVKRNFNKNNDLIIIDENVSKEIDNPDFDIFAYVDEVGRQNTLEFITFQIFFNYDLYSVINISAMEKFTERINKGYISTNLYHNEIHAADVLQTTYSYILHSNAIELINFDFLDLSALFIAAMIHDFKHPGFTNMFLINTKNDLAITFNDISVLESYHISEAFKVANMPDSKIFSMLTNSEFKIIRKKIIDSVLATDMTKHAHGMHYMKSKIDVLQVKKGVNMDKIFVGLDDNAKNQTKQEIMNTFIHLADISNPTKPLEVYKKWADKVMSEFWHQGDKERELGLPISFLCDRNTVKIPSAQVGFMEGIVSPLASIFTEMFPSLNFIMENLNRNSIYYKKLKEES